MHDPSFQGERPLRLKREDDDASVLWGDDWRMPTFEEITMLADMSKFTWTVSSAGKDFYYEVTSKQTGNSIYLPLSGGIGENGIDGVDWWGGIWASSQMSNSGNLVSYLRFNRSDSNAGVVNSDYRFLGYNIRPVFLLSDLEE